MGLSGPHSGLQQVKCLGRMGSWSGVPGMYRFRSEKWYMRYMVRFA